MTVSLQQTEKLLKGNYRFSTLGFSMLITRLKGLYVVTPTQAILETAMGEINAFLTKFKNIMKADCTILETIE